jgi:hypothetical protein
VVFRAIYYLLPFLIGVIGLVADELHQHRAGAVCAATMAGRVAEHVTPIVLAILTFVSGLVVLLANATPAAPGPPLKLLTRHYRRRKSGMASRGAHSRRPNIDSASVVLGRSQRC